MLIPVLVLAVPIFDTVFVSLMRLVNRRAISQGGKDHSSHRLVTLGLSERTTVLLFYMMSLVCGGIALMGLQFGWFYPSVLATLIVIVFWYFGIFLSGVVTSGEKAGGLIQGSRNFFFNLFWMEKKRLAEVLIDSVLIALSFTVAFAIRFDGLPSAYMGLNCSVLAYSDSHEVSDIFLLWPLPRDLAICRPPGSHQCGQGRDGERSPQCRRHDHDFSI